MEILKCYLNIRGVAGFASSKPPNHNTEPTASIRGTAPQEGQGNIRAASRDNFVGEQRERRNKWTQSTTEISSSPIVAGDEPGRTVCSPVTRSRWEESFAEMK